MGRVCRTDISCRCRRSVKGLDCCSIGTDLIKCYEFRFIEHMKRLLTVLLLAVGMGRIPAVLAAESTEGSKSRTAPLPKILIRQDKKGFVTSEGKDFVPFGVTYYRPGTGWAPQVWKQWDAEKTKQDFALMKSYGINCVRVFLSFGSFYPKPGQLDPVGLEKFDAFLSIAEEAGIYVHPTGPDHWEGLPEFMKPDRYSAETSLQALEMFWKKFAERYRGRTVIFAYDLLNEPEIGWDTPNLWALWNRKVAERYQTPDKVIAAWGLTNATIPFGRMRIPRKKDAPGSVEMKEYQAFREDVAETWTRRQVEAIRAVDPSALITAGLVQWSVPVMLASPGHYSAFRPERQSKYLDFMEIHFYPLDGGPYEYQGEESEMRNLAYLESVVRDVARNGKPVVVAEFGWYGGGKPKFDNNKHPAATEAQQAQWCSRLIDTTAGMACGWLNWGFFDQPEATDASEMSGLVTAEGKSKVWGTAFKEIGKRWTSSPPTARKLGERPEIPWEACVSSAAAGNEFRKKYLEAFLKDLPTFHPLPEIKP